MSDTLIWNGKSAVVKKVDNRPEDLQFDFADLLSELRIDLQSEREKEEHLLEEIKRELEGVVGNKGLFLEVMADNPHPL